MTQTPEYEWESSLRRWMSWAAVVGASLFAIAFFAQIMWVAPDGMWDGIAKQHFAAAIGLPCAAIAALFIVIVLRSIAGPIEVKGLGFEFRGASGPIVMWIACFLAITFAISSLWPLRFNG